MKKSGLWEHHAQLEKRSVWALLVAAFLFLYLLFYFAESTFDLGDGIRHYLIARYSWKHPLLFLDSWGKPFFTLLSSPFAQFGIKGIILFNTLCGVASAFLAFKILKVLKVSIAWPVIPIVLVAPGYFPVMNSGLTEPLFGLMLLLAIYAVMVDRFIAAALIISVIPFVRTEGFLMAMVFGLYFIFRKNWLACLCLATGTLLYSVIGGLYLGNFLWIISENPYDGSASSIYGHGTLLHFFYRYKEWSGIYIPILALSAVIVFIAGYFTNTFKQVLPQDKIQRFYFFTTVPFLMYLFAHVLMWWQGWANSLGLTRPLAAVLPLVSVLAYFGFYILLRTRNLSLALNRIVIALLLILMLAQTYKMSYFSFRKNSEYKVLSDAADWIKASNFKHEVVFFGYPLMAHLLDVDIFDKQKMYELWSLNMMMKQYMKHIPDSTLAIWDSHFAAECKISLKDIEAYPEFKQVAKFSSLPYDPIGKKEHFEVLIYCKSKLPLKEQFKLLEINFSLNDPALKNSHLVVLDSAVADVPVVKFTNQEEFGTLISVKTLDLPKHISQLSYTTSVLGIASQPFEAKGVLSVYDENNNLINWQGKTFLIKPHDANPSFDTVACDFIVNPDWLKSDNTMEFYIWNYNKQAFYQKGAALRLKKN